VFKFGSKFGVLRSGSAVLRSWFDSGFVVQRVVLKPGFTAQRVELPAEPEHEPRSEKKAA
jgi:hypothetical protein